MKKKTDLVLRMIFAGTHWAWLLGLFLLSACGSRPPQVPDEKADTVLGVHHAAEGAEAAQTLNEIREKKIAEHQESLEQQINNSKVTNPGR